MVSGRGSGRSRSRTRSQIADTRQRQPVPGTSGLGSGRSGTQLAGTASSTDRPGSACTTAFSRNPAASSIEIHSTAVRSRPLAYTNIFTSKNLVNGSSFRRADDTVDSQRRQPPSPHEPAQDPATRRPRPSHAGPAGGMRQPRGALRRGIAADPVAELVPCPPLVVGAGTSTRRRVDRPRVVTDRPIASA
jgi:hypothetical protein